MAGKKYRAVAQKIEKRPYALTEAIPFLQQHKISRFDETVEVHLNLGVDPRHADQMVRGTVVLPHGLGIAKKVLVIASGDKVQEAIDAGGDFVGGEEYVNKIAKEGWLGFERGGVNARHDALRGPPGPDSRAAGLDAEPQDRHGDIRRGKAVTEVKAGKVEFRVDKGAVIHAPVGKLAFDAGKLKENAETLISAVLRARPQAAKGRYLMKASICSTMSPALTLDVADLS